MFLAFLAAVSAAPVATGFNLTVVPWCNDSMRVMINPLGDAKQQLRSNPPGGDPGEPFAALDVSVCAPGKPETFVAQDGSVKSGNLQLKVSNGVLVFSRVDTGLTLFRATPGAFAPSTTQGYVSGSLSIEAADSNERIFGLGQGNWTNYGSPGCASKGPERVVPLQRNGQTVGLQQQKFHVSIPFAYSTAGYGFLWNMPGQGRVDVGAAGVGGMQWRADATTGLDFWVTGTPDGDTEKGAIARRDVYSRYADATGHAPPLRENAMIFWQSRNRYKSTDIVLAVCDRYKQLDLPVGVIVVDYKNMDYDGDFQPNPLCYPSVKELADGVTERLNATMTFSFWPEAKAQSAEYELLNNNSCLINSDLGGRAIDPTTKHCRDLIWNQFLKPRYYDQGVSAYWLDETDGEGTGIGDGQHGYDTSYGPAAAYSNLWVNDWLKTFTDPVAELAVTGQPPMALTRGVWAGGQKHGVVLWSSDIESTFEELHAQINLGVHASLSGVPWWTSDVGGYGCGQAYPNGSPYMQELIVRWYQFGLFCPVFRTHGCRAGGDPDPNVGQCQPRQKSCGPNEIWSYNSTKIQDILASYITMRAERVKPYIVALDAEVTTTGAPTMRPLWYEFPDDIKSYSVEDQYMLGPNLLVAPVYTQGATSRTVYFPDGTWKHFFDGSTVVGPCTKTIDAPLESFPVYERQSQIL